MPAISCSTRHRPPSTRSPRSSAQTRGPRCRPPRETAAGHARLRVRRVLAQNVSMTSLWNAVRPPGPVAGYGLSLIALAAVLALRWALDPLLGDTMPIVTLYGAVAAAIWLSGLTAAVTVTIVGYVIADYFLIEPRGALGLTDPTNLVGFLAYLLTCTFIIAFGSLLRIARAREADAREVLQVTLHSIGDAVITTDLAGTVTYLNDVAKSLTGWDNEAIGRPLESVFHIVNETTRERVLSPAQRALREGVVVGLANH